MMLLKNRPYAGARIGLSGFAALACLAGAIAAGRGEALEVRSEVKSLAIVPAREIPKAPPSVGDRASCEHLTVKPTTEGGCLVASRGWAVTGEVHLLPGGQDVSFAGKFEPGTSGSCLVSEGNVAIFRDGAVQAIAYAPRTSKETIGKAVPLADGHARIWGGDYLSQPIADLHVENDGNLMALVPLATEEKLCGGRAVVPNIYGMPIDAARRALASKGWTPVRGDIGSDRDAQGREIDLVARSVTEVDSCSGTGFAFCNFRYRGPAGTLSVSTVGDDTFPSVAGYDAACR